jgi:translocation and assembly module TamA
MMSVISAPSGVTQTAAPLAPPPKTGSPSTPQGSVGPTDAAHEVTAFDIVVRAPGPVRALLEQHLELQRYRAVTDLDDSELARLVVLAERNVRNLVGTLGFFSPNISITREPAPGRRTTIIVAVEPGEATRVKDVNMTFTGDIAESTDRDAISQRENIERNWRLPAGQLFTQNAWDDAKTQALRDLVARRYPTGRIADSLADIDAPAHSANLGLRLDSGPTYRLGPMKISGVERYNPALVPRIARLKEGAIYDQNELLEAQQRLSSSGYFDSANVFINPGDSTDPLATPVQVQVREAKLQKIIFGIGITTDSGPRVSVEHTHQKVPGTDWRAVTKLQLERKSPSLQTEWTSLPDEANWRWAGLARAERLEDDNLVTRSQRLRFGRNQIGDRIDRNIYVQYDRARVQGTLAGTTAAEAGAGSAVSANYVWTGRYFDSLPFPGRGYGLGVELGGGLTLTDQRLPYLRTVGRWLGIHPLQESRIAIRAEAGAVFAKNTASLPSTELFRTGGDATVRGYGYRDIGIKLANGVTGPGRYLAVGSVEWQRPLRRNGLLTEFENTFFIDAGAVGDTPRDLRPSVGIGTGIRWKSPIGPLQFDIAYGVKVKQLRLHTSVGFVF